MTRIVCICFLLLVGLLSHQTEAVDECSYDSSNSTEPTDCPLAELTQLTKIFPGGEAECLITRDEVPYFFQVKPGSGDDANNLLLNFDGGGFCADVFSCRLGLTAQQRPILRRNGIFDTRREDNPFRDWTVVDILYCSGDAFTGDAYSEDGSIAWKGAPTVRTVLDWVYVNVPEPDRLLVTSCSSGAAGAQYWSRLIIDFYKPKGTIIGFVYDSLSGELTLLPSFVESFTSVWNSCETTRFVISQSVFEFCQDGQYGLIQDQTLVHNENPDIPFVFLSYKSDLAISLVYCLEFFPFCTQSRHYNEMLGILRGYTDIENPGANNVVSYLVNGAGHCLLERNAFYTAGLGTGLFGRYTQGSLLEWMSELAYRDPATTVIESQCTPGLFDIPFVSDTRCDPDLTGATFDP